MENNEEKVVEQPSLEDLRRQKEELERAKLQAEIEALNKEAEERAQRAKEQQEVAQYNYTKPVIEEPTQSPYQKDLEAIKAKYDQLIYAVDNYELGHPAREGFKYTDRYNGKSLGEGYLEYKNDGKKIEEIFPKTQFNLL